MCGICGIVQVRGEPRRVIEPEVLDRMTDAMTHRGPNDRGTYLAPGVALGVRRLSVVDVEGGHQPFANEDGAIWAIQNGELYNHAEIRRALEQDHHRLLSRCDTEILPHLYEREGDEYAARLRGKFATAVWDGRRRRAVLARDRLGVKPLYFAVVGDVVVFASELKSVVASGLVPLDLDLEAIEVFLMFGYFPAPRTPLRAVRKLLPGHVLKVGDGSVETTQYWSYPKPRVAEPRPSLDEAAARLLVELDEAVRLRLMSDVPLGAMLSGGLDSSLIVALMARHSEGRVKTFSVGFADEKHENELADARYVADVFGAEHHELELSYADASVSLEDLVWYLDEPVADLSALGFLALSDLAARHVTVALAGQGADELFGGYKKHRAASHVQAWRRLPPGVRRLGERVALRGPRRFHRAALTLAAADPASRQVAMSGQLEPELASRLLRMPRSGGDVSLRAVRDALGTIVDDPLPATLFADGVLALPDDLLHYFDRTSMARSLEVRVPFLDHEVVEYAATLPAEYKVRGRSTKIVLKHASRGIVPDRIIDKRKIGFFRGTTDDWFRAQLDGAVAEYLLDNQPRCAQFLDRSEIASLVSEHHDRGSGRGQLLLAILLLEVWLTSFLPRARRSAEPVRVAAPATLP